MKLSKAYREVERLRVEAKSATDAYNTAKKELQLAVVRAVHREEMGP